MNHVLTLGRQPLWPFVFTMRVVGALFVSGFTY